MGGAGCFRAPDDVGDHVGDTPHTRAWPSGVKTPVFPRCARVCVLRPCRTPRGLEAGEASPSSGLGPGLRSTELLTKWLCFKILTSLFRRQPHPPASEFPLPLGNMPSRSVGGKLAPRESRGPPSDRGAAPTSFPPGTTVPRPHSPRLWVAAPLVHCDTQASPGTARASPPAPVFKMRLSKFEFLAQGNRCLFLN